VKKSSLDKPQVVEFVKFYLDNVPSLIGKVGYVALPLPAYDLDRKRLADGTVGTIFGKRGKPGASIVERLQSGQ